MNGMQMAGSPGGNRSSEEASSLCFPAMESLVKSTNRKTRVRQSGEVVCRWNKNAEARRLVHPREVSMLEISNFRQFLWNKCGDHSFGRMHLPMLLRSECVLFTVTLQNNVIINKNMGKVSLRLQLMNILYYTEHPCKTNKSVVFKEWGL